MPEETKTPDLSKADNEVTEKPTPPAPAFSDKEKTERPELSLTPADNTGLLIVGGSIVGLMLLLLGFTLYLIIYDPALAAVLRDVVIIYLGLAVVMIIGFLAALTGLTVYLALKINDLIKLLDREIKPALHSLQETMGTLRGTATFVSDNAVRPVIETASAVTATRKLVRSLFPKIKK